MSCLSRCDRQLAFFLTGRLTIRVFLSEKCKGAHIYDDDDDDDDDIIIIITTTTTTTTIITTTTTTKQQQQQQQQQSYCRTVAVISMARNTAI